MSSHICILCSLSLEQSVKLTSAELQERSKEYDYMSSEIEYKEANIKIGNVVEKIYLTLMVWPGLSSCLQNP